MGCFGSGPPFAFALLNKNQEGPVGTLVWPSWGTVVTGGLLGCQEGRAGTISSPVVRLPPRVSTFLCGVCLALRQGEEGQGLLWITQQWAQMTGSQASAEYQGKHPDH